jgi:Fic family protein
VRGTYAVVSDQTDRSRTPDDVDDLFALLHERHRIILEGRPEAGPGEFKRAANQAGGYVFVDPTLVEGTLEQAFTRARSLQSGFARAVYWLFALAEIHPFADGNGRIARIFMNAELSATGQARIIVPTVFRNEYLNALRLLSVHGDADALVKVCDFAQRWGAAIDFSTIEQARATLEATNAFVDPSRADATSARLLIP